MTLAEYEIITADLMQEARRIEDTKRPGYTGGNVDVLANFKRVADRTGMTSRQVWAVYVNKHFDAINAIMCQPDLPVSEAPLGRFADGINYLRLGYALLAEHAHD